MRKWILIGLLGIFCACCFGEDGTYDPDVTRSGYGFGYQQFDRMQRGNSFLGSEESYLDREDPFSPDNHPPSEESVNPFTGNQETVSGGEDAPVAQTNQYGEPTDERPPDPGEGFFTEYERLSTEFWREPVNPPDQP